MSEPNSLKLTVTCRIGYASAGAPFYRTVECSPAMVLTFKEWMAMGPFEDAYGMVVSFEQLGMTEADRANP